MIGKVKTAFSDTHATTPRVECICISQSARDPSCTDKVEDQPSLEPQEYSQMSHIYKHG